ncbi:MAG: hypothetical protein RLZZ488_1192 [Pseudomonadota bacterium]|jgi:hypothetical protein
MSQAICRSFLAFLLLAQACNKTVVSDKVVPVSTPVVTVAPPKTGIGDGIPDTKAIIRLTKANCEAERKSVFQLKVAGLVNTDWIQINCNDKDREIEINTKKGYCNVLQLKADVTFEKAGLKSESYQRSTQTSEDKDFFKVTQKQVDGAVSGVNIDFEDTNNDFWKYAYVQCVNDPSKTILKAPIDGGDLPCSVVLNGGVVEELKNGVRTQREIPKIVDWNDFQFTVESSDVQFSVEGFPNLGCKPN